MQFGVRITIQPQQDTALLPFSKSIKPPYNNINCIPASEESHVCSILSMGKWSLTLLVIVALVQVHEALSGSAGQAAALDPNLEAVEEKALPGWQEALPG